MTHFKQARKDKYVLYIPLNEEQQKTYSHPFRELKIITEYSLGGINYFSGGYNKRGYRVSWHPVNRSESGFEESIMMGNKRESGAYLLLEETNRFSAKRLEQLTEELDSKVMEFADTIIKDDTNKAIELAKPVEVRKCTNPKQMPTDTGIKSTQVIMTKEIKEKLPKLYANEEKKPEEVNIIVKFFDPTGSWTWYVTEGEPTGEKITEGAFRGENDYKFFGLVKGFETELGYFTLGELSTAKEKCSGLQKLPIERDIRFGFNKTLAEVMER